MHCIFGQFGKILDVVSRRTYRLRGQAWVVFEKAEDAKNALDCMQGFPFLDKPLVSRQAGKRGQRGWRRQELPAHQAPLACQSVRPAIVSRAREPGAPCLQSSLACLSAPCSG